MSERDPTVDPEQHGDSIGSEGETPPQANRPESGTAEVEAGGVTSVGRRDFMKLAGAGAGLVVAGAACDTSSPEASGTPWLEGAPGISTGSPMAAA